MTISALPGSSDLALPDEIIDAAPATNDTLAPSLPQLHGFLLRLDAAAVTVGQQLDHLLAEVEHSGGQIDALTRHLAGPDASRSLEEHLAELIARQETQQEQLTALEQAISRLSRTQFKANALAESQDQQTGAALNVLRDIANRRDEVQNERTWRDQQFVAHLRAQARGELAADLLPALDGLDAALENGQALLERRRQQAARRAAVPAPPPPPAPSFGQRMRLAFGSDPLPVQKETIIEPAAEIEQALTAWLAGLTLVRERFLGLLAGEGIQIIPAQDQPFDPRLHVAVEAEPRTDVAAGMVVKVVRKGYQQYDRILRFAEVVVAKSLQGQKA